MSLGFAVLGTVIFVFIQTFSLIEEARDIRTARDISRKILIVNIVYYHAQSDIFRYYFVPNERNLFHINSSVTSLENVWRDFSFIAGQNKDDVYEGGDYDLAALADNMKKFAAANNECLNLYVNKSTGDASKAMVDVKDCVEKIPQDEFNKGVSVFSDRQIEFIDKKNTKMIDDFIMHGKVMLFLSASYGILLLIIIFWLKSLARFLNERSAKR